MHPDHRYYHIQLQTRFHDFLYYIVVTIAREYASGGRYVGKLLAEKLGVNFYDKELIGLIAKESGLSNKYIEETDEQSRKTENDDRIFIAETNVIKNLAILSAPILTKWFEKLKNILWVEELKVIDTAKNQDSKAVENAYKLKEFKVNLSPEILYQRIED